MSGARSMPAEIELFASFSRSRFKSYSCLIDRLVSSNRAAAGASRADEIQPL